MNAYIIFDNRECSASSSFPNDIIFSVYKNNVLHEIMKIMIMNPRSIICNMLQVIIASYEGNARFLKSSELTYKQLNDLIVHNMIPYQPLNSDTELSFLIDPFYNDAFNKIKVNLQDLNKQQEDILIFIVSTDLTLLGLLRNLVSTQLNRINSTRSTLEELQRRFNKIHIRILCISISDSSVHRHLLSLVDFLKSLGFTVSFSQITNSKLRIQEEFRILSSKLCSSLLSTLHFPSVINMNCVAMVQLYPNCLYSCNFMNQLDNLEVIQLLSQEEFNINLIEGFSFIAKPASRDLLDNVESFSMNNCIFTCLNKILLELKSMLILCTRREEARDFWTLIPTNNLESCCCMTLTKISDRDSLLRYVDDEIETQVNDNTNDVCMKDTEFFLQSSLSKLQLNKFSPLSLSSGKIESKIQKLKLPQFSNILLHQAHQKLPADTSSNKATTNNVNSNNEVNDKEPQEVPHEKSHIPRTASVTTTKPDKFYQKRIYSNAPRPQFKTANQLLSMKTNVVDSDSDCSDLRIAQSSKSKKK